MGPFIRVQSPKFVVLPGEDDELINLGMYGKALAEYLVPAIRERGYEVPFVGCEDWGWWIELAGHPFVFGVCIYGVKLSDGRLDLYVTDGAIAASQWSWRRFRFISTAAVVEKLHCDLIAIFRADPDVQLLGTDLEGPFVD